MGAVVVMGANLTTVPEWQESEIITGFTPGSWVL